MANLKGGNAIVRLLLAHGEKLGIAAVAICAGMLIWSAIKHDSLSPAEQPDKLVQLASQASQHVEGFTWNDIDPNSKLVAKPVPGGAMVQVASEHFPPIREPWIRPVLDPVSLRTDPDLLAAEDLEVYGDSGMWALADPEVIKQKQLEAIKQRQRAQQEEAAARAREEAEDERGDRGERGKRDGRGGRDRRRDLPREDRGRERDEARRRNDGPVVISSGSREALEGFEQILAKSWVTIVAKVPIEKQYSAYDDALMKSSGYQPNADIPLYWGYIVERAEISGDGQGEWARVASVNDLVLERKISFYPFDPQELVSGRYTHPLLTHPLPPLVLRDWDRRVTHSSIPLMDEDLDEGEMEPLDEEGVEEPQGEDDLFAARSQRIDDQLGSDRRTARSPRRSISRQPMMRQPMSRMEGGEFETERGGPAARGGSGRRGDLGSFVWDGETPYALFRYFDDDVQPGHRYRYRVRLALVDVNHEVSEQFLDKTVTERRGKIENEKLKAFRFTEWSEPSRIASVPMPARIYLVSAEPANTANFNSEPEASILVQAFNSELPAEIAMEDAFLRGTVINVREKAKVIWVSRADLTEEQENQEFDFRTGITVVDFRGGEKFTRDLTAPAHVVLMDPAGRLFMQSELDDSERVKNYRDALEGDDNRRGGMEGFRERRFEGGEGEF